MATEVISGHQTATPITREYQNSPMPERLLFETRRLNLPLDRAKANWPTRNSRMSIAHGATEWQNVMPLFDLRPPLEVIPPTKPQISIQQMNATFLRRRCDSRHYSDVCQEPSNMLSKAKAHGGRKYPSARTSSSQKP